MIKRMRDRRLKWTNHDGSVYGICTRNQFARAPHRLGRAYFSDKSAFLLFFGGGRKGKKGTVTIMKKVAVIMGSASDLAVAEKATARLASLGIEYEAHVYSAHRTPSRRAILCFTPRKTASA